ncbi:IS66 family transposase [Solwaraspora sp. WMMA2065]|uniref:IS66 family transposase n=1 Tax=Solwaraspora sp. WMMA2065 TaxID=3015166 RepID=UPI00259B325C|nr:IS66 family transposase [Solwaraspora sp. WMMA2065]WJK34934.1 IS66 family transposase [Solwaraspora sp. WMMA2065]WJK36234.1 IS66 family transposase [Solwaraspora sp. WMMA2065]
MVEANERWERLAGQLREENAALRVENERLRERDVRREAELERVSAELAVLQRLVFGRSSERVRPQPTAGDGDGQGGYGGEPGERERERAPRRGPGGRAGRRDYSHLPRVEVVWDFAGGGYCCPDCSSRFEAFDDHAFEQVDWRVTVRVVVHRRRRYRRRCRCAGARTVTAPGPPKAVGKGRFSNGFIAMLLVERFVAGRSRNSLIAGLARQGAEVSSSTLVGTCAAAGTLLAPLEERIVARSRDSWHPHADETSWHVFTPDGGDGPARWWLWVFIGADTTCFVMDPTRAGAVLARHAGIDTATGQLTPHADGGPRRLVVSSDFYTVYASAGRRTDGLTNLYCWAHVRRYFVRAGDANPTQLACWTRDWLDRIKALYHAHDELTDAWNASTAAAGTAATRLDDAYTAWDTALQAIDTARQAQMASPGLQQPAKKALATLDREWDGLTAHRDYPMISLDNNTSERALRRPVITRKNAYGSRTDDAARLAATVWTVTATAEQAGLNVLTYLTAYLDACGRNGGRPLTGPDLQRFLPWTASPADLHTWAQPPPTG